MTTNLVSIGRSAWFRPVALTLVALILYVAYVIAGMIHATAVLPSEVKQAAQQQGTINIEVELGFEPERFNTSFLQDKGSLIGIDGTMVRLLQVDRTDVDDIARQYWVQSITILGG